MVTLLDIVGSISLKGGNIDTRDTRYSTKYSSRNTPEYECADDCDCIDCPSDCICMDCQDCED